jgi:hypothetical protein
MGNASGSIFPEQHIPDGRRPGRKPIPTRRVLEAAVAERLIECGSLDALESGILVGGL